MTPTTASASVNALCICPACGRTYWRRIPAYIAEHRGVQQDLDGGGVAVKYYHTGNECKQVAEQLQMELGL